MQGRLGLAVLPDDQGLALLGQLRQDFGGAGPEALFGLTREDKGKKASSKQCGVNIFF